MPWSAPLADAGTFTMRLLGCALLAAGAALSVWGQLSLYRPLAGKRLLGVLFGVALLVVGAIKMSGGSAAPEAANASPPPPMPASNKLPAPHAAAARPVPKLRADELAEAIIDHTNGYSIRLPPHWQPERFDGSEKWVMDATDGKIGVISVGFSPLPATADLSQMHPEFLAVYLRSQPNTTLLGRGHTVIDGRECLWFRYTAPLSLAGTSQLMMMVHYFVPLHDGRMLELRLAVVPQKFSRVAPLLRRSIASVRMLP